MEEINFTESQLTFYNRKREESKEMSCGNNNYMFHYHGFNALKLNKTIIDTLGDFSYVGGKLEEDRLIVEDLSQKRLLLPKVVVPQKLVLFEDRYIGNVQRYYDDYISIKTALENKCLSNEQKKLLLKKIKEILLAIKDCGFYYHDIHSGNYIIDKNLDLLQIDVDDADYIHHLGDGDENRMDIAYQEFEEHLLKTK